MLFRSDGIEQLDKCLDKVLSMESDENYPVENMDCKFMDLENYLVKNCFA